MEFNRPYRYIVYININKAARTKKPVKVNILEIKGFDIFSIFFQTKRKRTIKNQCLRLLAHSFSGNPVSITLIQIQLYSIVVKENLIKWSFPTMPEQVNLRNPLWKFAIGENFT